MPGTMNDLLALEHLPYADSASLLPGGVTPRQQRFRSFSKPEKMGNAADIAYGGCVLSMTINAAFQTLPTPPRAGGVWYLYSCNAAYVGPTLASDSVDFVVDVVRETRTFQTRRVEARQVGKDGKERLTFFMLLDFMAPEPTALYYSIQPEFAGKYSAPESLLPVEEAAKQMVERGELHPKVFDAWQSGFALARRLFEMRYVPEAVNGQNLLGMRKRHKHTQWGQPLVDQTSAFYVRSRTPLGTTGSREACSTESEVPGAQHGRRSDRRGETCAAIGFIMDAALAFLPATLQSLFLDDYGAISSLDASLRFHEPEDRLFAHAGADSTAADAAEGVVGKALDMQQWLLIEQTTEAGGDGRTYSTGRLFIQDSAMTKPHYAHPARHGQAVQPRNYTDLTKEAKQRHDGEWRCLATMTQQCVMRPKKARALKPKPSKA